MVSQTLCCAAMPTKIEKLWTSSANLCFSILFPSAFYSPCPYMPGPHEQMFAQDGCLQSSHSCNFGMATRLMV